MADPRPPVDALQDPSSVRAPTLHRSGHQIEDLGLVSLSAEVHHAVLDGRAGRGPGAPSIADALGFASEHPRIAIHDVAALRHQDRHRTRFIDETSQVPRRREPEPRPRTTQQHPGPGPSEPGWVVGAGLVDGGGQAAPVALSQKSIGRVKRKGQARQLLRADHPGLGEGQVT